MLSIELGTEILKQGTKLKLSGADGRVVINNNGPDLINSAGILAIHFL
jgi:hypothetical protein